MKRKIVYLVACRFELASSTSASGDGASDLDELVVNVVIIAVVSSLVTRSWCFPFSSSWCGVFDAITLCTRFQFGPMLRCGVSFFIRTVYFPKQNIQINATITRTIE